MPRRTRPVLVALAIGLAAVSAAFAAEGHDSFEALTQTTVYASGNSPTGYMVTFRYVNYDVEGGHQWDNWRQVLTWSLRNFLWK